MDTDRVCLVSRMVVENQFEIGRFFRVIPDDEYNSGWVFLFGDEDEAYLQQEENLLEMPLSQLILHNARVRDYVDSPIHSEFVIKKATGRVAPVTYDMEIGWGYARNPAKVWVNPLVWASHHPRLGFWTLLHLVLLVLCLLVMILMPFIIVIALPFLLVEAYLAGMVIYKWVLIIIRYQTGDTLPGMVLSAHPPLVAVGADLHKGAGYHPVVKVISTHLRRVNGMPLVAGMRIPVVVVYSQASDSSPSWNGFDASPVHYATDNLKTIQRVMGLISEEEWKTLEGWIRQAPQPCDEGLYGVKKAG